jgi:hypothetical protein
MICMEQVSARALAGAVDLKPPAVRARALWGILKSKDGTGNLGLPVPSFPGSVPEGAIDFGSGAPECYKATVNESETINEAKLLSFGSRQQPGPWAEAAGFRGFPVVPFTERS